MFGCFSCAGVKASGVFVTLVDSPLLIMTYKVFLSLLVVLSVVLVVRSVAVGLDLGSSSYKAVLVQNKFRIVLNEQSGRKTSTSIAFRHWQRTFSSAADNVVRTLIATSPAPRPPITPLPLQIELKQR